jgi:hypothetical protein
VSGPSPGARLALLAFCVEVAAGCATYSESLVGVRDASDAGNYAAAIEELDQHVGAAAADALPTELARDGPLALLERGLLLQADERFSDSARDLSAADAGLEWLDLSDTALGKIGEYVYSDSAGPYQAPPSERLALNAFNLLNFLVRGDLSGAAVEARRYTVLREYLEANEIEHRSPLGAYLAGFVFEQRGEGDRALRYYDEALAAGAPAQTLAEPIARLAARFPYRTERLRRAIADHPTTTRGPSGELLVVVATGRVPYKVPERIPIGAAVGLAGTYITGDLAWLDRGITKVVVYPELVGGPTGHGPRSLRIDGAHAAARLIDDIGGEVRREYAAIKPRILGAALSRLIVRAAASEGVRAASREAGGWASLIAILVEGALVALDRPDTRSWTLLPAQVAVARVAVTPGEHAVEVELFDETRRYSVEVPAEGFAVVVVTAPR